MLKCIINRLVLTAQLHSTACTNVAPPGTRIIGNGCSARLHHHRQLSSCLLFSESPHSPSAAPTPVLDQGQHRLPIQDLPQGFWGGGYVVPGILGLHEPLSHSQLDKNRLHEPHSLSRSLSRLLSCCQGALYQHPLSKGLRCRGEG